MPIDSSMVELDKNRIINLGLFESVEWEVIKLSENQALLQFIIIESRQSLPPLIFPSYDEEKGWSIKGVYLINNYKGENISTEINISVGGQKQNQFIYFDPWIMGKRISLLFFISNNEYDHLFLENSISDKTIGIKVGKRINNKYRFSFSPKFISKNFFNIKESLNFNYFVSEFEYELDTRDIFWSPQKGYRLINKLTPLIGENQFITWDFSSSVYIPLLKKKITSPFILAINTTLKRKWGYRNDVWLNYFGNSFNIRGWVLPNLKTYNQNTKYFRFGHEYIFFSLELRKLIESKKNYKFSFNKGLDMVLFFDGGYISNNIITAEEKNFMFGLGIGFRIPFPLLECFRIDFAWGLKDNKINNKPTVHFAIKQKF